MENSFLFSRESISGLDDPECPLCRDHLSDPYVLPCSHRACKSCLVSSIRNSIGEGKCPGPCFVRGCEGRVDTRECTLLLQDDLYKCLKKIASLEEIARIPQDRRGSCPACQKVYDKHDYPIKSLSGRCQQCGFNMCAWCESVWHTGLTCCEYRARTTQEAQKLINESSDMCRCPRCSHVIQRNGGCLHMTCRCGSDFCAACGQEKCVCLAKTCGIPPAENGPADEPVSLRRFAEIDELFLIDSMMNEISPPAPATEPTRGRTRQRTLAPSATPTLAHQFQPFTGPTFSFGRPEGVTERTRFTRRKTLGWSHRPT